MLIDDKYIEQLQSKPQEDESKVKKDCFVYDDSKVDDYRCCALEKLYCKNEKCNFYKPRN